MSKNGPVHVALVLATSTGGVGQHVRSLTSHLLEAGHRVTVCGPAATNELFGFSAAGARFCPVEIASGIHPIADTRAVFALRRALDDIDVVHAHGYRAGFVALTARQRQPLVVTWHNVLMGKGFAHLVLAQVEKVVARGANITLSASHDLVTRALRLGAVDARFAPVAAPPLPAPQRARDETRAELAVGDRPVVLSVGRLHPQKAFDVLVHAAVRWMQRTPPPLVVIAGSGPQQDELAELAQQLAAPVVFLGRRSDVADLLAASDVAVVTSDWEARQLFAQEALRAGTPLVTTAVGGIPELVGDGALMVPPRDVDAVAKTVGELLDDPGTAAQLVERGKRQASSWPSEADTAVQAAAVYAELLGRVS